jgi:hypothetical protein
MTEHKPSTPSTPDASKSEGPTFSNPFEVWVTPQEPGRNVQVQIEIYAESVQAWRVASALIRAADHLLGNPGEVFNRTVSGPEEQAPQEEE